VLLAALAVSLGTAFLFGLAPAWRASKTDVVSGLKEGGATGPSQA
jgi:ABC-type antimicrobial peptide transport system permease subunit